MSNQDPVKEEFRQERDERTLADSRNQQRKLEPFQSRVIDEKADLDAKIARLAEFNPAMRPGLDPQEKSRLIDQLTVMRRYSDILEERIGAFAHLGWPDSAPEVIQPVSANEEAARVKAEDAAAKAELEAGLNPPAKVKP